MDANAIVALADRHRTRMEKCINPLNERLRRHLNDDSATVIFQQSDGWCLLSNDEWNSRVDLNAILKMGRDEALDYIEANRV